MTKVVVLVVVVAVDNGRLTVHIVEVGQVAEVAKADLAAGAAGAAFAFAAELATRATEWRLIGQAQQATKIAKHQRVDGAAVLLHGTKLGFVAPGQEEVEGGGSHLVVPEEVVIP